VRIAGWAALRYYVAVIGRERSLRRPDPAIGWWWGDSGLWLNVGSTHVVRLWNMNDGNFVFVGTGDNFGTLVIENSRRGPVMVHFWAPWAGPCLKLMPELERLAQSYGGKLLVVNVNTDREKALAREYQVRSLPTLKVMRNGQVVHTFYGGQPQQAFREVLDRLVGSELGPIHAAALEAYRRGDLDRALGLLDRAAEGEPNSVRIPLHRAKMLLRHGGPEQALASLGDLSGSMQRDPEVDQLKGHLELIVAARHAEPIERLEQRIHEQPEDLEARFSLGAQRLVGDDFEGCLEQMIEILRYPANERSAGARRALLAIFSLLGEEHELVKRYRSILANLSS
jgi:putative thioredoxin